MFSFAPRQVELTMIPKRGRKQKEIAQEYFEKSMIKLEESIARLDGIIKLQEPTVIEMRKNIRSVRKEVKDVERLLVKYKNIQYKPKRTRDSHNTGLEKLRPISENMALFAGWDYGVTQKSRYDITNVLCTYIKENDLRDPTNKTIITPDAKLKKLLQIDDDVVLKYPTMQKYLKNCFEDVVEPSSPQKDEKEAKRGRKPREEVKEVVKAVEEPKTAKKVTKKEVKVKKEVKTKK